MTPEARAEALALAESLAETYGDACAKHYARAAELEVMAREQRHLVALLRVTDGQAFEPGTVIRRRDRRNEIDWKVTGLDHGYYTCVPARADRCGWSSNIPVALAHDHKRYEVVT